MAYDEGTILQEALANMPCVLRLSSWNDAVSLKARLTRYIKSTADMYADRPHNNPFANLEITILKPGLIKFRNRDDVEMHQLDQLDLSRTDD